MVPRLAAEGSSFHGAFLYYCHDKKARTSARVAWAETVNLMTDCCETAVKVMAYTAKVASRLKQAAGKKRAGDKVEKPVISYSLSWHPEQKPDKETMLAAARETITELGLDEHEAMIVAHRDEPQPHVHVIVNRIHPLTGMAANLYRSKRKLQKWAREYQRKEGTMYCPKREENHRKRKQGQHTRYVDPVIAEAWKNSRDGEGFASLMEAKGYQLARGRKRLVVVDAHGKTVNPVRHLEDVKAKAFHERMEGIDPASLPEPEEILAKRKHESAAHDDRLNDFEARVSKAMGDFDQRQAEEWRLATDSSRRRVENKRTALEAHYHLDQREATIARLQHKLDSAGFIPRIARRLFGTDRKLTDHLEKLKANQSAAKQRFEEGLSAFEKSEERTIERLEERQAQRRKSEIKRLEAWRPKQKDRTISKAISDQTKTLAEDRHPPSPSMGQ